MNETRRVTSEDSVVTTQLVDVDGVFIHKMMRCSNTKAASVTTVQRPICILICFFGMQSIIKQFITTGQKKSRERNPLFVLSFCLTEAPLVEKWCNQSTETGFHPGG